MKSGQYEIDIVKLAVGAYFSDFAKEDQPTRDALLELVKEITIGGRYLKIHFELIYNYIAKHPEDLLGSLNLIENLICIDSSHIPMFYFSDVDSFLEINPMLYDTKSFANGFGIAIWFRIETNNEIQTSEEVPSLFSIYSNGKGGFEAYFSENTLYYKSMKGKQYINGPENNDEAVYNFEPERWYQLYIFHSRKYVGSEVKFFVDTQLIKEVSMEYPKMDDVGKLDRGYICKNFTGQVSSILILSGHLSSATMMDLLSKFPKEVNAEKFIDELDYNTKCKEDKVKDKLFALFVPSRVQASPTGEVY